MKLTPVLQFEQKVEAVAPKYINSLVELIANGLDSLAASDEPTHHAAASNGFLETPASLELTQRHFAAQLAHIKARKDAVAVAAVPGPDWAAVQIGAFEKRFAF